MFILSNDHKLSVKFSREFSYVTPLLPISMPLIMCKITESFQDS